MCTKGKEAFNELRDWFDTAYPQVMMNEISDDEFDRRYQALFDQITEIYNAEVMRRKGV